MQGLIKLFTNSSTFLKEQQLVCVRAKQKIAPQGKSQDHGADHDNETDLSG